MKNDEKTAALVTAEQKGSYTVWLRGRELPAVITGRLLGGAASRLDLPVVGDLVDVSLHDGGEKAVIHAVLPRSSLLLRKGLGSGDAQPLAANIGKVFIVMGLDGNYNLARLERLLVATWDSGAVPVTVLTKADLCPAAELQEKLAAAEKAAPGVKVICLSSLSGEGVEKVAAELAGGVRCCFVGSSGAGKSTLLNRLAGREAAETGAVREADSRGRHTTTARQLHFLPCGAQVIDTPGIREFCVQFSGDGLDTSFADVTELAAGCRFRDCGHCGEPGCAVAAAVEAGTLAPERLKSYRKLLRETEIRERRDDPVKRMLANRKLRAFGRLQKEAEERKRRLRGG